MRDGNLFPAHNQVAVEKLVSPSELVATKSAITTLIKDQENSNEEKLM
jgi:hypothetical protein